MTSTRQIVDSWSDVAERLCSAAWLDPAAAYNAAIDAGLHRWCFPCGRTWIVFKSLAAFAECDATPTEKALRDVAEFCGYTPDTSNDKNNPDLIRRLDLIEASGVGARNFAAKLAEYARRRGIDGILRAAHARLLDMFITPDEVVSGLIAILYEWRLGVSEIARPPRLTPPDTVRPMRPQLRGRVVA